MSYPVVTFIITVLQLFETIEFCLIFSVVKPKIENQINRSPIPKFSLDLHSKQYLSCLIKFMPIITLTPIYRGISKI